MSSGTVRMPVLGLTASTSGDVVIFVTGMRSDGLYDSFGLSAGLTEMLLGLAISNVYPSAGDLATMSAAMLEPAPGLLSTITGCPSALLKASLIARATYS